jgi:hypothetical protein
MTVTNTTDQRNGSAATDTTGVPEIHSPGNNDAVAEMNREIQGRIDAIARGWSAVRVVEHVDAFLRFLVEYSYPNGHPSRALVEEYLCRLIRKLKTCKYQPQTHKQYANRVSEIAKLAGQDAVAGSLSGIGQGESASSCSPGYYAITGAHEYDPPDPDTWGMYRDAHPEPRQLANVIVQIDRDIQIEDDFEPARRFEGEMLLYGEAHPFSINAGDFGSEAKLRSTIFESCGPKALILCKVEELQKAISTISTPERRIRTTNFGWTPERDAYLVPSGRITAAGFQPISDQDPIVVDLSAEEKAALLDLVRLDPAEISRIKRHIVQDFLAIHDQRVTCGTLGAVAAAILAPFADGVRRFALWLHGPTGAGKSFLGQLAQNFFGRFPLGMDDQIASWTSTVNYLQRLGYFFKDAVYVIDDFKLEFVPPWQAIRLIQNYADGTARDRLRVDATANRTRPIRGFLIATGEEMPEQAASVMARSIKLPVRERSEEERSTDILHGRRCLETCTSYSGVTADFIKNLLHHQRLEHFAEQVLAQRDFFHTNVGRRPNALRIAGNFALLAAAFREFAGYLGDVWPEWEMRCEQFVREGLVGLCNDMVLAVQQERASAIFLGMLADLIHQGRVTIEGFQSSHSGQSSPRIGRSPRLSGFQQSPDCRYFELSTSQCLQEVNESLRRQGKPPLRVSYRSLLTELLQDGRLVDRHGRPLGPSNPGDPTEAIWMDGRSIRVFRIGRDTLLGEENSGRSEAENRRP